MPVDVGFQKCRGGKFITEFFFFFFNNPWIGDPVKWSPPLCNQLSWLSFLQDKTRIVHMFLTGTC